MVTTKKPGAAAGKKVEKPKKGTKKSTSMIVSSPERRTDADVLMVQAIEKGADIGTIERLVALRKDILSEEAKIAFNEAMSDFQSECPVIQKTKGVNTKAGKQAYKYAPIESIVLQVKEFIKKHGFRYTTTMELSEGKVKVTCRVVHKLGHEEVSSMEVPLGTQTAVMSQSQVVAAASTFAKRYAFLNAFGIMTGDEDNDTADQRKDAPGASRNQVGAPLPAGEVVPAPPPSVPAKPTCTKMMEDMNTSKDVQQALNVFETAKKYKWSVAEANSISVCFVNRYCTHKDLMQKGQAGTEGQVICNAAGEPVGMVKYDALGFANLCKYEEPAKPKSPSTTGVQGGDSGGTTPSTTVDPTDRLKELKDDLEAEESQYEIACEHPTDTDQFRKGMENQQNRIMKLKEEIANLEKPEVIDAEVVEDGGITKSQIKEIHVLQGKAKMDDGVYRGMLQGLFGTDVKSCKQLDPKQADEFMDFLCTTYSLDRISPPAPEAQ